MGTLQVSSLGTTLPSHDDQSDMDSVWDTRDVGSLLMSADDAETDNNETFIDACFNLTHHYRLKKTSLFKNYAFRVPVIVLLIEVLIIIVLRSVIAVITYRRRLVKIFIAQATPILNEHYYDNPPAYVATQAQPPAASVLKTAVAQPETELKSVEPSVQAGSNAKPSENPS